MKAYKTRMHHWGCIEWIESFEFENLPIENQRTNEEQWRTFTESLTKTSRKRYGSTSAWNFSLLSLLLTNFKCKLNAKIVGPIKLSPFPLFIGENWRWLLPSSSLGCFHQKQPFLQNILGGPKWAHLLFIPHILISTPPFSCFWLISFRNIVELYGLHDDACFLSETSRNFTDYVTMLV